MFLAKKKHDDEHGDKGEKRLDETRPQFDQMLDQRRAGRLDVSVGHGGLYQSLTTRPATDSGSAACLRHHHRPAHGRLTDGRLDLANHLRCFALRDVQGVKVKINLGAIAQPIDARLDVLGAGLVHRLHELCLEVRAHAAQFPDSLTDLPHHARQDPSGPMKISAATAMMSSLPASNSNIGR